MKLKLKNLLKFGFLTIFSSLFVFVISCSKEVTTEIDIYEIKQIQSDFSLENYDNVFVKNNIEIDWDDFNIYINPENELETYEFNTHFKTNSSILDYNTFKLLASKNKLNDWDFEIIKFTVEKANIDNDLSYFLFHDFTGSIYHYNMKGENTLLKVYNEGNNILEVSVQDYDDVDILNKAPVIGGGPCVGCWEWVTTLHFTDWYNTGNGVTYYYSHSTYEGSTRELAYSPGKASWNGMPYDSDDRSYHNHYDYPHGGHGIGGSDNHDNEDIFEFDLDLVFYGNGLKPLYEFNNKCTGITQMWQLSQNSGNEFAAVLTTDGAILITQQLNTTGGGISGVYEHNGTTYYQYPTSQGAPARTYNGQIQVAGRYFIPITATIHSHTPCINDGTDGISNNIINDDQNFATNYPTTNHYIIGCNSIGQFNGNSNQAFNIQNGNLSLLCNNIN